MANQATRKGASQTHERGVPPDPCEWDFRGIPEGHLALATIYEFARESPHAQEITEWLASPFPDQLRARPSRWIYASQLEALNQLDELKCERLTVAKTIGRVLDRASDPEIQSAVLRLLARFLPEPLKRAHLVTIALLMDRFPEPYLHLMEDPREGYLERRRAVAMSLKQGPMPLIFDLGLHKADEAEFLYRHAGLPHRKLLVDVRAPVSAIRKAFNKWLKDKIEHPETHRGRHSSHEWLRWLSAYRLKNSGMKYAAAKSWLDNYRTAHTCSTCTVELPNYQQQTDWDERVAIVDQTLKADFVTDILADFKVQDHPIIG